METMVATKKRFAIFTPSNIIWVIANLFFVLFLYTAVNKLIEPEKFLGTLNDSPLLKPFAPVLTYSVPIVEILISGLLLFNLRIGNKKLSTQKIGLIAGGVLMVLFTAYIAVMLLRYDTKDLPCSCGGFISALSWTAHIYFNLAFIALAVWALILYKRVDSHT